jgi:O-acetyl-ADP-ribose deacetylase (regulator of RNase III)
LKGYIDKECQKKLEEKKRLLDEGIIKVSEHLKSENKEIIHLVVSKEVRIG